MRLHYYRFPENSDPMVRFEEGCAVILKTGEEIYDTKSRKPVT